MDGFEVLPMEKAAAIGDIFCTATGDKHVIARGAHGDDEGRRDPRQHGPLQRRDRHPGAAVARVGDARGARVRRGVHARRRPAHLPHRRRPAREPRPPPRAIRRSSWTCRFANQALSAEYAVQNAAELERKVYRVPEEIDEEIARLKLETMGVEIDTLTEEQAKYLASWDEGT